MPVSFEVSELDSATINLIALRFQALVKKHCGIKTDLLEIRMDITACHANGCPLYLGLLARADDFTLLHDVDGIRCHIDRRTGRLTDHFLPRSAKRKSKRAA